MQVMDVKKKQRQQNIRYFYSLRVRALKTGQVYLSKRMESIVRDRKVCQDVNYVSVLAAQAPRTSPTLLLNNF